MHSSISIIPLNKESLCDVNKSNEPFKVIGRLDTVFNGSVWNFSEELFQDSYMKQYHSDELDYSTYINNESKTIFLAYIENSCIGQIRIRKNWNKYCYIEDIAVSSKHRNHGVGKKLINTATDWAKKQNLCGLMLETQDINLIACRFYKKCGFIIGAVDTMLYANFNNYKEKALFWYLKF